MIDRSHTPQAVARQAVTRLRTYSDPVRAAGATRYFKGTIQTFGATASHVRAVAADLYRSVKGQWTVHEAITLCDILFARPELESKGVGALVLNRFKKDFPALLFDRIKGWLEANRLDNWASVDVFCTDAMAALLKKYPALVNKIRKWPEHPNRWVKRASAVSFIKLARDPRFLPAIYDIALFLLPANDDLVQKANGWLLREAGKTDMKLLAEFLLRHGPAIPRTTVRYAIERFDERARKKLLLGTK
jgi:3-methyladenine DNA glycosylase AlkD